ncbi:hypothetical protein BKA65DRAFT_179622 [Rhexocercosporidium sp. MPI-PUGE-AT-0058]|nr:hypothetical protein BKA65DRAFT_179622 [Rhexocercosporidium sp. MPI-PUGE-AT-0058]
MTTPKRTVLITGCSDGGLGAALAIAFHKAGLHVYATSRNLSTMTQLTSLGIQTLTLDVLSQSSINVCASHLSSLDILVNNAGAMYAMPISDLSILKAKELFDLNVWSYLAVTQAFLPLLLESKGIVANHTSSASVITLPFQATYNASKAAMAVYSDTLRLELEPFGVRVVDLKSGSAASNMGTESKVQAGKAAVLPKGSLYEVARERVERTMSGVDYQKGAVTADKWAEGVVGDLLKGRTPKVVWKGKGAWLVSYLSLFPSWLTDGIWKGMTGLDVVAKAVNGAGKDQ